MVDTLADEGVELMVSPYFHFVSAASKNAPQAIERGLLVRNGTDPHLAPARDQEFDQAYIYDAFSAEARGYAFGKVANGYVKPYGLRHWWLDCDETCGLFPGQYDQLVYNNGTWPASFVGAAYPHMLAKMVHDGMSELGYADDNVMLGRSAWAGSQRYGAAVWSGDTKSDFSSLRQQFKAGLNLVMSGLPYWTTDIGGYNMYNMYEGGIESPRFRQLIVRWFQVSGLQV
jgi:alpha-D-xyloside xylohydrolase